MSWPPLGDVYRLAAANMSRLSGNTVVSYTPGETSFPKAGEFTQMHLSVVSANQGNTSNYETHFILRSICRVCSLWRVHVCVFVWTGRAQQIKALWFVWPNKERDGDEWWFSGFSACWSVMDVTYCSSSDPLRGGSIFPQRPDGISFTLLFWSEGLFSPLEQLYYDCLAHERLLNLICLN